MITADIENIPAPKSKGSPIQFPPRLIPSLKAADRMGIAITIPRRSQKPMVAFKVPRRFSSTRELRILRTMNVKLLPNEKMTIATRFVVSPNWPDTKGERRTYK
jgi:hypothetical protein